MAEPNAKPPKGELGSVVESYSWGINAFSWNSFQRQSEETPELKWPKSVRSFRLMMNDSQLAALYAMTTLPIRGYTWRIDPNGCDEQIVRHVAGDFGLPIFGDDTAVKKSSTLGFKWKRHLYHVLKAMIPGHQYFEIAGEVLPDGLWHLKRLGLRPPETIIDFDLADDGMLKAVAQYGKIGMQRVVLPIERLAVYLWDAEDGDWLGHSMLRSCYRDWLVKDRLIRVNAINIERGGGMPWVETEGDVSGPQMQAFAEVAKDWKVHEDAGTSMPPGAKLHIEKASAPDAINSIRYHDESMARAWLAMFAMLGQTQTGSRALGSTFVDFFGLGQRAIADDLVCDPTNEHVIRRMVEWNYGPQDSLPLLSYEVDEDILPVADLVAMVNAGLIVVDEEVQSWLTQAYNLPLQSGPIPKPPITAAGKKKRERSQRAAEVGHRQSNAHEIAAAVDFEKIEQRFTETVDDVLATWQSDVKPVQIEELKAQIEDAGGDLDKLAAISVVTLGADVLMPHIEASYGTGQTSAIEEADTQSVELTATSGGTVSEQATARGNALANTIAAGLVLSASAKAVSLSTSDALAPAEVATAVAEHLTTLTDSAPAKSIKGAVQSAFNGGRFDAMSTIATDVAVKYFASELLDSNTCGPCAENDGNEYESLEALMADYPVGYIDCDGGDSCRGTGVAEYGG